MEVDLDVDGLSGLQCRVVVLGLLDGKRLGDLELLGSRVPGSAAESRGGSVRNSRRERDRAHQGRGNKGEETHIGCKPTGGLRRAGRELVLGVMSWSLYLSSIILGGWGWLNIC